MNPKELNAIIEKQKAFLRERSTQVSAKVETDFRSKIDPSNGVPNVGAEDQERTESLLIETNQLPRKPRKEDFNLSAEDLDKVKKFHEPSMDSGGKVGCAIYTGGIIGGGFGATSGGTIGFFAGMIIGTALTYYFFNEMGKKVPLPKEVEVNFNNFKKSLERYHRDLNLYQQTQEDYWFSMDGHKFEHEFGKLLELDGYEVTYTQGSGDGGVDLIASKYGKEAIIQCKAWKAPVGPGPVRELQGVRSHNQDAWMVCLGGFTNGASEFAKQKDIKTISYSHIAGTVKRHLSQTDAETKESVNLGEIISKKTDFSQSDSRKLVGKAGEIESFSILRDRGIITEEEFQQKKKDLLA